MREPVIDREGNKAAAAGQKLAYLAHGGFVVAGPASAMDRDHRRAQIGRVIPQIVNIEAQCLAPNCAVGNIVLDVDLQLGRVRKPMSGRLGRRSPGHLRSNGDSRSEHHNGYDDNPLRHEEQDRTLLSFSPAPQR
jgi:hypothetical protein